MLFRLCVDLDHKYKKGMILDLSPAQLRHLAEQHGKKTYEIGIDCEYGISWLEKKNYDE
jgi:hypothetical protein